MDEKRNAPASFLDDVEQAHIAEFDATCHTEDCPNADIAISLSCPEPVFVVCGVCGYRITDVAFTN